MLELSDVGSTPFNGDYDKFLEASKVYSNTLQKQTESAKYFEDKVVEIFVDKLNSGIDVPTYPQLREMNSMFLGIFEGIDKMKEGYYETGDLSISKEKVVVKEVDVIHKNSAKIEEIAGNPFKMKVCITGPYTLSCFFAHKDNEIFGRLAKILTEMVKKSIFDGKHGRVQLVSVDEPTLGFIDDPLLDIGAGGREDLIKAWEMIFHKLKQKKIDTCMHLHDTTNNIFWDVKSLNVIESHVNDPIYFSEKTKKYLSTTDKFLKASISISHFDNLIRNYIVDNFKENEEININQKLGKIWGEIKNNTQDPAVYLENAEIMQKRLLKILDQIGSEKIIYAGPECGLKSFPTYETALKCLKTNAEAVTNLSTN